MSNVPLGSDWWQTPDGKWHPPATGGAPGPSKKPSPLNALSVVLIGVVLVLAAVLVAVFVAYRPRGGSENAGAGTTTPATLSIASRTDAMASFIDSTLCESGSRRVGICDVEATAPGVLTITLDSLGLSTERMRTAGESSGLWTAADAERMGHTRALDGTQRSAGGGVSWTYHPDHGLQIVAEVAAGPAPQT